MSFFSFFIGESSLIKKYYHQTGKPPIVILIVVTLQKQQTGEFLYGQSILKDKIKNYRGSKQFFN
jgi:hypothetical protein